MADSLYERLGKTEGITRIVDDVMWALDKHGMTGETKKDVLAILYSLKAEIIRV